MSAFDEVAAAPDGAIIIWHGLDGLREVAAIQKAMELNAIGVDDEDVRGFGRAITCYASLPPILLELGGIEVSGGVSAAPEAPSLPPAEEPATDTPAEPVTDAPIP